MSKYLLQEINCPRNFGDFVGNSESNIFFKIIFCFSQNEKFRHLFPNLNSFKLMRYPYYRQEGGQFEPPPPSGLFRIALKPFVLLTFKFVTFPKYDFNTFSQKFSSIYFFLSVFSCTFRNPRPNFPSSPLLNRPPVFLA